MKTLQQIKDEVAKSKGFSDWKDLLKHQLNLSLIDRDMDEAAKLYVNEKLERAAEEAEIEKITQYPDFPKVFRETFKSKKAGIIGIVETLSVDKQSILDLREK